MVDVLVDIAPSLQGEQRVVIRDLTWQAYEQILSALPESRSARLTYDQGTLEITMPLEDHASFAELNYPNLNKGAEADKAFYIQNQPRVAGRTVDLKRDPPPDLVVEVDITHTDIDKNRLYASMGVPELWRFNGKTITIYQLQNQAYVSIDRSPTFPQIPRDRLYKFLQDCAIGEVQASKSLRQWLRKTL
jgi:Uma2 family endonuclease